MDEGVKDTERDCCVHRQACAYAQSRLGHCSSVDSVYVVLDIRHTHGERHTHTVVYFVVLKLVSNVALLICSLGHFPAGARLYGLLREERWRVRKTGQMELVKERNFILGGRKRQERAYVVAHSSAPCLSISLSRPYAMLT